MCYENDNGLKFYDKDRQNELIKRFAAEYIKKYDICSPESYKRKAHKQCVRIVKTGITIALSIWFIVKVAGMMQEASIIILPVLVLACGGLCQIMYDWDSWNKPFSEFKQDLARFFWFSEKLEQMCYMSYDELLNDYSVNEIIDTEYMETERKRWEQIKMSK